MIVDPPYSSHVHKNAVSQAPGRGVRDRDFGFGYLSRELQLFIASQAARAKRWSLIYSDIEGLHSWKETCEQAGAKYIRPIPWVRWSMPQLSGDRPPSGCEFVTTFWGTQKGKKSWNGPGNLTHLAHKSLRGEGKHKAEKPLDQALDLVSWFSNPGETVADFTAGAGTTGLACRLLGRKFLGYEIDRDTWEAANTRILTEKLSDRDQERYDRWQETQATLKEDAVRRAKNTAKVREKLIVKQLELLK